MCGSLFASKIQTFLWPRWPSRSLILSFIRALHSLCLFISSLGRVPPWVGRNGWTMSYPTLASWGCYNEPMFWRPSFHPAAYPTFETSLTSVIWPSSGVLPPIPSSCGEVTVTLEDVANQLLSPILGDVDPATLVLLLNSLWLPVMRPLLCFWLCKFVFGSHPHYIVKHLYFRLAIKISAGVSLPLVSMFLRHLYVQLDILRSDESQASSCHMVTSSVHSIILQHLLYKHYAKHLSKCGPFRFTKEKYQPCSQAITNFCDRFESNFPLAFC